MKKNISSNQTIVFWFFLPLQGLPGPPGDVGPEGVIGKKVRFLQCWINIIVHIYSQGTKMCL